MSRPVLGLYRGGRLRDGTRVPDGAFISVKMRALDASPDPRRYYSLLESLEDVITVRII